MSVTEQTPVNSYIANGVTADFSFTFLLLASGDLDVYINNVVAALGADYSISGLGVPSGGSVHFLVNPANLSTVVLQRNSEIARAIDYQDNGDLLAATLNTDIDRVWLALQELIYKYKLAPTLPAGSPLAGALILPDPEAGLYLRWNALESNLENANPGYYSGTVLPTSSIINTFADLATTPASTAGMVVYIKQHTSGGIGGGYFQDTAGTITNNGGTLINNTVTSGRHWKRINYTELYAEMFGAVGDGVTDCTSAILAAAVALRLGSHSQNIFDGLTKQVTAYSSGTVFLGRGVFVITQNMLDFSADLGFCIEGQGMRGRNKAIRAATTLLITASGSGFGIRFYGNGARGGRISNLDLNYSNSGYTGDLFVQTGAPGSYPDNCYLGSYGVNGGSYLYSARSCCAISFDEFFYPQNCVFDGAQYGVISNDTLNLCSFTGSISTTTLTVTAIASGSLGVDLNIYGSGVTAGTRIVTQLSGPSSGTGTYQLSISQTVASTAMTADLSFGGSNTNLIDCVFYDITVKHVWHQGNRARFNFALTGGIINPISQNCQIGLDIRNCHPVTVSAFDMSGSVGNSATNGWVYLENCEVNIKGTKFGIGVSAGTLLNCNADIRNCNIEANNGFNLSGGTITKGGNRFGSACVDAWTSSPANATYINFDPDTFDNGVTNAYKFSPLSNNLRGIVRLNKESDLSTNAFLNVCPGVEFTSFGTVAISASGTTIFTKQDAGRTYRATGGANQIFALPVPVLGIGYKFIHDSNFNLTIACTGGTNFATGIGAIKTLADILAADKGGSFIIRALSTTLWSVESVQGTWTYT
jgi:hypothetical protein